METAAIILFLVFLFSLYKLAGTDETAMGMLESEAEDLFGAEEYTA